MLETLQKDLEVQKQIVQKAKDRAYKEEARQSLLNALIALGDTKDSQTVSVVFHSDAIEITSTDAYGRGDRRLAKVPLIPTVRQRVAEVMAEALLTPEE